MSSMAYSAGTVTITTETLPNNSDIRTITYTCTADAADGSFPSTALTTEQALYVTGYHCYLAVTDPGATAPTDDYDIAITDTYSCDVFGGALADRDTANSEQVAPAVGSAYGGRTCAGVWTLAITNNSVNSAVVTLVLYFSK